MAPADILSGDGTMFANEGGVCTGDGQGYGYPASELPGPNTLQTGLRCDDLSHNEETKCRLTKTQVCKDKLKRRTTLARTVTLTTESG